MLTQPFVPFCVLVLARENLMWEEPSSKYLRTFKLPLYKFQSLIDFRVFDLSVSGPRSQIYGLGSRNDYFLPFLLLLGLKLATPIHIRLCDWIQCLFIEISLMDTLFCMIVYNRPKP